MRLTERKWLAVTPQLFTSNGTNKGLVTVADTSLFRVKQKIKLKSLTQSITEENKLEVKRILSETQMIVGPGSKIEAIEDLSMYLVSDLSSIEAQEQARPSLDPVTFMRSTFEEEPIMAIRTILVDKYGERYSDDNPLPVEVVVDLDGYDQANPDSVNITGSEDGTETGIKHGLQVNADGDASVLRQNSIVTSRHDEIDITRDLNGKISSARFLRAGVVQQELELTRDLNGAIINVKRS